MSLEKHFPTLSEVEIETERLLVREIKKSDAQAIVAVASDEHVTKWLPDWIGCSEWINSWIKSSKKNYKVNDFRRMIFHAYAVIEKKTGKLIGTIGSSVYDDLNEVGICYFFGKEFCGKGYGTEAIKEYSEWFIKRYPYDFLIAMTSPENFFSNKALVKAGFVLEKSFMYQDNFYADEKPKATNYYRYYGNRKKF